MPLGLQVDAPKQYAPDILHPIQRQRPDHERPGHERSKHVNVLGNVQGFDLWTCWELYWLDSAGFPRSSILQFSVPCDSLNLVESKSLKLYLNGFNYERMDSETDLLKTIQADLENCLQHDIECWFTEEIKRIHPKGRCLDQHGETGEVNQQPELSGDYWSASFRSLCPVTAQPDFATIYVENFCGKVNWLKQLWFSYSNHQGFHEQCVEAIFQRCQQQQTKELKLGAAFTRRGGIDIHPIRYDPNFALDSARLFFSVPRQ